MERITITGSSGYLGCKLVEHYRRAGVRVQGMDIVPASGEPTSDDHPDEFCQIDICSPDLGQVMADFRPDSVIHAAFVFRPMRDEEKMHRINVDGTRNVLSAVAQIQPKRFLTVSSATAYGAWPDNPVPMEESWPLRARDFQYAADKTEVEQLLTEFEQGHELAVSWVRPAIIGGPHMDNYLSRFIFGMPLLARIGGADTPLQFVHEVDVVNAIAHILTRDARGAFNVGPPDWTPISEIARATNRRAIPLPYWLARSLHAAAWLVRLPIHESPASFLDFARYPWVVSPARLQDELEFQFQYTSLETVQQIAAHQSRGKKQG